MSCWYCYTDTSPHTFDLPQPLIMSREENEENEEEINKHKAANYIQRRYIVYWKKMIRKRIEKHELEAKHLKSRMMDRQKSKVMEEID